jgi:hypothetical protein
MISIYEVEELLEQIRCFLAAPNLIDESMLNKCASEYAKHCRELNSKLAQAAKLIDRGLRDDAMQLLGAENQLIEVFELCEFPEREDWCELTEIYGIAPPPPLNVDAAAKVNRTFSLLGDLESLLKVHRNLNLARAPLVSRMQALHALARNDSDNPIWQEDLGAFRKVRAEQVAGEVDRAISAEDFTQLENLKEELEGPIWNGSAEPKLVTKIRMALAAREQRQLHCELEQTSRELLSAYAECDIARAFATSQPVIDLLERVELPTDSSILSDLEPALEWVESMRDKIEQGERELALIDSLEYQLEHATNSEPLELAYQRALSIGSRLPDDLRVRALERIQAFQLQARRRLLAIVGSITVCLLFAAGSLLFWIYSSQREAAAQRIEVALSEMLERESLDEAEAFISIQNADMNARTTFQLLVGEVSAKRSLENNRAEEFARILEQLKSDDSPQPNEKLLVRLKELAKTSEENRFYQEQEQFAEEKRLIIRRARQAQSLAKYDELESQYNSILRSSSDPQAKRVELRSHKLEATRFLSSESEDHAALRDRARQLMRRIDTEIEKLTGQIKAADDLEGITGAVGDIDRFRSAIEKYVRQYPTSPVSSIDLQKTVDHLKGDSLWIGLVSDPILKEPSKASSLEATRWIESYNKAIQILSGSCLRLNVSEVAEVIRSRSKLASALADLETISRSPLLDRIYIYPLKGVNYYSPDVPSREKSEIEYFTDSTLSTRKHDFNRGRNEANIYQVRVFPNTKLSGQSDFGIKFRKLLQSADESEFENLSFNLLNELRDIPLEDIDPLFKLRLFRALLQPITAASTAINGGFGDFLRILDDATLNWDTNWLSVEVNNPVLNLEREKAKMLLRGLENWDQRRQKMSHAFRNAPKAHPLTLKWIGWIAQNESSKVALCKEVPSGSELIVFIHQSANTCRLVKLGTQREVDFPIADINIPIGAAVYAMSDPGKQ